MTNSWKELCTRLTVSTSVICLFESLWHDFGLDCIAILYFVRGSIVIIDKDLQ